MRPCVQSPVLKKRKTKKEGEWKCDQMMLCKEKYKA
jgi:hypothetical protein